MTHEELLLQLTTKLFNKTDDEIKPKMFGEDGAILDTALDNIIELDAARVKRLKDDVTKKHDEGHKKGKAETAAEIERLYRERFGITTDGNYEAIADAIAEQLASTKSKGKEITEDDVKRHPAYLKLEKEYVPKAKYEELDNQFNQFKNGIERRVKYDKVKERAMLELENLKPDYPDVPLIKQNYINAYLKEIESFDDFEIVDGEIHAIKDGKRAEDDRGNPTTFSQIVKEKASGYFKFLAQDPKGSAGNKGGQAGNQQTGKYVFKNKDEAIAAYENAKQNGASPEELKQIIAAANAVKS